MLTGIVQKLLETWEKVDRNTNILRRLSKIHVLVIIFSRKSFFLALFPPEAAAQRSPNTSGWIFSGQFFSGNILSGHNFSGRVPARCFSGRVLAIFLFGRVTARFFLVGSRPGFLGLGSPFWVGSGPENYSPELPPHFWKLFWSRNGSPCELWN